jgi:hypothetical protein
MSISDKEYLVYTCNSCSRVVLILHESADSLKKGGKKIYKYLESSISLLPERMNLDEAWKLKCCTCFTTPRPTSIKKLKEHQETAKLVVEDVQAVTEISLDNSKKECNFG